jgi:hypothetical protein
MRERRLTIEAEQSQKPLRIQDRPEEYRQSKTEKNQPDSI